MVHDPLSPSEALRTPVGTALAVVSLLLFAYSLVIVAQLLLGVIVGVALPAGLYLSYRVFAALDAVADAAQRIATVREREADEPSGFGSASEHDSAATDRDAEASQSVERASERER
jgi:hypothetical protein